jgi:RimJ/RimL family protein N-acetyltransferase
MLRHAFEEVGCIRVEFKADAGNAASRRALVRIGAQPEGVLRNYRVSEHQGVRDLAVFSIIASEWPAVRKDLEGKLQ